MFDRKRTLATGVKTRLSGDLHVGKQLLAKGLLTANV